MDEALLCDKVTILRDGEILTLDTPQRILEQGKTLLKISETGELKERVVDSTPEAIAKELQQFGLKQSISSITIHSDSIEDIILAIIGKKEK